MADRRGRNSKRPLTDQNFFNFKGYSDVESRVDEASPEALDSPKVENPIVVEDPRFATLVETNPKVGEHLNILDNCHQKYYMKRKKVEHREGRGALT